MSWTHRKNTYVNALKSNNNSNSNNFRKSGRNNGAPPTETELKRRSDARIFRQKRGAEEHKKLDDIFKNFASEVSFNERLEYRIIGGRPGFTLYFFNMCKDNNRYLDDPRRIDKIFSNLCPIWEKLKAWCVSQGTRHNSGDKYAELSFAWETDEFAIEETGITSFEMLVMAKRKFVAAMTELREAGNHAFTRALGKKYRFWVERRRYDSPTSFKYVCNNAFISSKFKDSKAYEDDIACQEALAVIIKSHSGFKVTCDRFGNIAKNISGALCVTSSSEIELNWFKRSVRSLAGQKVYWTVFKAKSEMEKRENWTNDKKLQIFNDKQIDAGLNKGVKWSLSDEEMDTELVEELRKQFPCDEDGNVYIKDTHAMMAVLNGEWDLYTHDIVCDVRVRLAGECDAKHSEEEDDAPDTDLDMEKESVPDASEAASGVPVANAHNQNEHGMTVNDHSLQWDESTQSQLSPTTFADKVKQDQIANLIRNIESKGGNITSDEATRILNYCLWNANIVGELCGDNSIARIDGKIKLSGIERFNSAKATQRFSFDGN